MVYCSLLGILKAILISQPVFNIAQVTGSMNWGMGEHRWDEWPQVWICEKLGTPKIVWWVKLFIIIFRIAIAILSTNRVQQGADSFGAQV